MSDEQVKKKGIPEGPPIWVESLLNSEEYKQCAKKYPNMYSRPVAVAYNPTYHKGGKWRDRMGSSPNKEEIVIANKRLEELFKLLKEKALVNA